MKIYEFKGLLVFLICCHATLFSQNQPPEILASGNQLYCPGAPIPILTAVSITDPDPEDNALSEIFVQISGGYQVGEDLLVLGSVTPNITSSWSQAEGQLTLSGPATLDEFEFALQNVFFQTSETSFTQDREFSINLSDGKYLPSTGHFYIFEEAPGISWEAARIAAANQTYFGLQGYLATLTSLEEAQFSGEQTSGTGWIGANDVEQEGVWKWVTGPEAGTVFWQGAVNGNAVNGEFSYWNTNEPNNLNNEDYAHITDPSIGIDGSWNDLPLSGSNNPDSPYYPKGYIVEFGGFPNEPEINISANTIVRMPRIISDDFSVCGGENITISIEATTNNVLWYSSQTSDSVIFSGFNYETSLSGTTTFWLLPNQNFCTEDYQYRYPITITVNAYPTAEDIQIIQCDDGVLGDGISTFNLSNYNDAVTAGITVNRSVAYFLDAGLTEQIDTPEYINEFNNQVIYAQVIDTQTGCENTSQVTLIVNTSEGNNAVLEICDDEVEDGFTVFNLSDLENQILEGISNNYVVTYFLSYEDALSETSPLSQAYTNLTAYNQTIFVRITDGFDCIGINQAELIVKPLPSILEDETVYYCTNQFPDTITLYGGVANGNPNNYYYTWSTGETTTEIEISEPGIYTVDITEVNGCTNTRTITVLPSGLAVVESVEIVDVSDNNSIVVLVSGQGDYEFALDNQEGPYQSSNTFSGVIPGTHKVYIRDKYGCGLTTVEAIVLGFPKYFTPNGDGMHDLWLISGITSELFQNASLKILNRYGKLLKILTRNTGGWDGTYNGHPLPSDDYWFTVTLKDGRTISDHFTLKR